MKSENNYNLVPLEHNQTVCAECSIRRLALFRGIDEKELDWTQEYRADQFNVPAGREIYRETQPCDYLFTLYHGWVAIYKTLNNGKRQILHIALPGDMIGFQADMKSPMKHSAITLSDVVLCGFPRNKLPELLRKNLSVAQRLTELNARDMNLCQSRLLAIGQQSAVERIAFLCSELFHRIKHVYNHQEKTETYFPLSQEDIGDATGLTKIHVNRTLRVLREMNLIQITSRTLKIYDVQALSELGNFDPSSVQVYTLY
jgi:CRP-like cAMP-binding protein